MDRFTNRALVAEALHFEDELGEELKELTKAVADEPCAPETRRCREECHALRIELLRIIQQFGDSVEENATRLRVMRLDVMLDRLLAVHDQYLRSARRSRQPPEGAPNIEVDAPLFGAIRLLLSSVLPIEFGASLDDLARHVAQHPNVAPHSNKLWGQLTELERAAVKREVQILARTLRDARSR